MKTILFFLLAVISSTGYSQASVSATATVTVLRPLSITKEADLTFAEVAISDRSGTVVLSPDSSRTVSGGATIPIESGQVARAASFIINGEAAPYSISLPEEILLSDGIRTLRVNHLTHNGTGKLENGAETVQVGGTLHINGLQEPGTYYNAGDLRVTVQYK